MTLTRTQALRVEGKLAQIRRLAEAASRVFADDPLVGGDALYTALNNITSACDWAQEPLRRVLDRPVARTGGSG